MHSESTAERETSEGSVVTGALALDVSVHSGLSLARTNGLPNMEDPPVLLLANLIMAGDIREGLGKGEACHMLSSAARAPVA